MSRLIDADKFSAISYIEKSKDFTEGVEFVVNMIDNAPTVQAIPIEVLYDIRAEVNDLYNKYRSDSAKTHPDKNYERISTAIMGTAADTLEMVLEIIYNHMCGVSE